MSTGRVDDTSGDPPWSASEVAAGLDGLRGQIDAVDLEILERLNARASLVEDVGRLKSGGDRSPI